MHHHTSNKPLRRIDFLPVQSALWVAIVDCDLDYDLKREAHYIKLNRGHQVPILSGPHPLCDLKIAMIFMY